jgi:hypothetical protein
MVSNFVKAALVGAMAVPFAWFRTDDEKSGDDKKVEKKVEVKVLRLDGKDGGDNATYRVLLNDGDGKPAGKQPYLGVAIEAVPPALVAHLPGLISKDQGLLVGEVAEDSPAAKAGLKEYDVLLSYDDQKLYSGEQLTKLVRGDKPGHEVTLSVARAGKLEKVKVTIGEREMKAAMIELPGKGQHILLDPQGHRKEAIRILKGLDDKDGGGAKANVQTKSNSLSMRLETTDGDRFKAEIEFKNDKGETQKRTFEGTREEIHKQIEADKEIPEAIRKQFGHGLDFKGGKGAFQFQLPSGGFQFSLPFDHDDFPAFNWTGSKDFEQIIEQLSNQIDPALRDKLKGALRSIDEPSRKKDVPVDRAL